MTTWDLGALARAASGTIDGVGLPLTLEAVGTDTRSLPPRSLFVALSGPNFNGHDFVESAVQKGAIAVVIEKSEAKRFATLTVPRVLVHDPLTALGDMARYARSLFAGPVVAVTGSNGKTTTKELIACALGVRGKVHKTPGNFNNLGGLPLSIFMQPAGCFAAVLEMGMNAKGEIARLAEIANPTIAVITNVARAHLQGLGTLEDVARAKGELFASLNSNATAIVNADDPMVQTICRALLKDCRILSFGREAGVDVRIVNDITKAMGLSVELNVRGKSVVYEVPLFGSHNAQNVANATAVALANEIEPEELSAAWTNLVLPHGRFEVTKVTKRNVMVVDDSYNANPESMRAAFLALGKAAVGRRIAVLGDMFELGLGAEQLHEEVGRHAAESGIAWILALGPNAVATARGATEHGVCAKAYGDYDALLADLLSGIKENDWILVKGSRGMRMERVVQRLVV